jgi:integrase
MRRKKILILPKLRDRGGDTAKKWYIEFSMRDKKGVMQRKRYEEIEGVNINSLAINERYDLAKKFIEQLKKKLESGWSPFDDVSEVVYEDQLQYVNYAKIYKERINSVNNFKYFASKYINEMLKDLSKETIATYTSRLRIFGLWLKNKNRETWDITEIDNGIVIDFFMYLRDESKLCIRTYRSYSQLLFVFFEYLCKNGIIMKNPMYNIPSNRRVKDMGAERIYQDDLKKLMQLLDKEDAQLALACRFEYYCGLRPGYEMRLLKVGDIDYREGYSKVKVLLEHAKTNKRRIVSIPDVFLSYLVDIWKLNKCDPDYFIFGKNGSPGTKCIGKNNLRYRFNKFRAILNLPLHYKFYSMKHTGAVTLAEEGESIINIRDHLGHTSIATTEHYLKRHGLNKSEIIQKKFPKI